jgi:predicted transcriptional regulator of viral defense system
VKNQAIEKAFKESYGQLTTKELKALGMSEYGIKKLATEELIWKIKRGIYQWSDYDIDEHGLLSVIIPNGVLCLYSAAFIYEYTTNIPQQYHIAIASKRKVRLPDYPPITLNYWSGLQLSLGVSQLIYNDVPLTIFDREKTVCDFLKFRNKIDNSIVKEVVKAYLKDKNRDLSKLKAYSKQLNIQTIVDTYLNILL